MRSPRLLRSWPRRAEDPAVRPPGGARENAVPAPRRRSPAGAAALGGVATVVCLLPVFLTGALAVQLRQDLAFGSAQLGIAVATFRGVGAVMSPYLGRLADRMGATNSLRLATLLAAATSFGIAATAGNWATLVAWLVLGGCAGAFGQPAANRLLVNNVPSRRLGTAFGVKQSAPPTASMLAGLSLPIVALTLGWRWAFAIAGLLALVVAAVTGRAPRQHRRPAQADAPAVRNRRVILLLAIAFALGTSTASAVTTFYVEAAIEAGSAERFAGTVLAVASLAAVLTRLAAGMASDRIANGHLRLCAGLLATGSMGMVLLGAGEPTVMAVGALVALAGTWGYNSVFLFAMVRAHPDIPGRITGLVAPGALMGATVGPVVFGIIAETFGYGLAWRLTAALAVGAACAMFAGDRRMTQTFPVPAGRPEQP